MAAYVPLTFGPVARRSLVEKRRKFKQNQFSDKSVRVKRLTSMQIPKKNHKHVTEYFTATKIYDQPLFFLLMYKDYYKSQ